MNVLVGLLIISMALLALTIAGLVVLHFLAPVRLTLPDDPHLVPYGDLPHAPYAALRSPTEHLLSSRTAVSRRRAGGSSVSGAAARRDAYGAAGVGVSLRCCFCREGYQRERRLFQPHFEHALPNGQLVKCEAA